MKPSLPNRIVSSLSTLLLLVLIAPVAGRAEQCFNANDMDAAARSAMEQAALRYFNDFAAGNTADLQRNANTALSANFAGVQAAVSQNQAVLAGAQASTRATYLLETGGSGTLQRAEFLCGIWGTPQFVSFEIPNLPAGRYGLVIEDVKTAKQPYYVSFIVQQEQANGPWKLAGFPPPAPAQVLGHDAPWYLSKAREFKSKGQMHNAYFYYQQARALVTPVGFMSDTPLVKLDREAEQSVPNDLPVKGPVALAAANGKSYSVTQVFPAVVENGMDLVVKYSVPDIADTSRAFQDNNAVIKAIVDTHPEFRETFQGVVARATDPAGHDYGTLLAMKDIK